MATFTSSRVASTFPVFEAHASGLLCRAYGTIEIAANPTAAQTYAFCKVPANAIVTGGMIIGDDLDTGVETLDMDIGWAATADEVADPNGFGNLGVLTGDAVTGVKPEVGIRVPFGGVLMTDGPKTFTAEATIQMVCNVTAATGGTGTLTVMVDYLSP